MQFQLLFLQLRYFSIPLLEQIIKFLWLLRHQSNSILKIPQFNLDCLILGQLVLYFIVTNAVVVQLIRIIF
jgi:hypothetical protein